MLKFKNIPDSDKPRERLYIYGAEYLSNEELISIILKTGSKNYSVKEVSLKLLEKIDDISKLKDISIHTLTGIVGIGKVKAIEIKAALELGRRVYINNNNIEKIKFNNPLVIYNYFNNILRDKKQEYFYTIYLDNKGNLIDKKCLFIGTINTSQIHPREIFKEAYLLSATSIVCLHNHPSGDPSPSREDINVTINLKEISVIHGINFLDHIVIGDNCYYSFHDDNKI